LTAFASAVTAGDVTAGATCAVAGTCAWAKAEPATKPEIKTAINLFMALSLMVLIGSVFLYR
jgi:hypothetical protein